MQTKHLRCVLIHIWTKGEVGAPWNRFMPSIKIFLMTAPRRYFFYGSFVLFMSCVYHTFTSVHCCLVVTWRERADLLALVCDVYFDFVTFPFGILWKVRYCLEGMYIQIIMCVPAGNSRISANSILFKYKYIRIQTKHTHNTSKLKRRFVSICFPNESSNQYNMWISIDL